MVRAEFVNCRFRSRTQQLLPSHPCRSRENALPGAFCIAYFTIRTSRMHAGRPKRGVPEAFFYEWRLVARMKPHYV